MPAHPHHHRRAISGRMPANTARRTMSGYAARKILAAVPLIAGVLTIVFLLVEAAPGGRPRRGRRPDAMAGPRVLLPGGRGLLAPFILARPALGGAVLRPSGMAARVADALAGGRVARRRAAAGGLLPPPDPPLSGA